MSSLLDNVVTFGPQSKMASFRTWVVCFCIVTVACQGRSVDMQMIDAVSTSHESHGDRLGHLDYCNMRPISGLEGEAIPGYSLKSVHIVMSPGQTDISSHTNLRQQPFSPLNCDQPFSTDDMGNSKLDAFKQSLSGHYWGRRDHPELKTFHPTFPNICSKDHITVQGFEQVQEIGEHLRNAYLDKIDHKQLKPFYSSVFIESVQKGPSYQSTLAFLHSLLPQKQFEKTKIHIANSNFCDKSGTDLPCDCVKLAELRPHITQALMSGRFMFKSSIPDDESLLQRFGLDPSEDISSLQLLQLMLQYKCNNISRTCDDENLCFVVNQEKLLVLHNRVVEFMHKVFRDPVFQKYAEMRTLPFLQQFVAMATRRAQNETLFLHLGDKFFVQFLKTSLGIQQKELTPLASRIVLERFQKNHGHVDGGRQYFRVLYNGAVLTDRVADCRFTVENDLCPLESLTSLIDLYREQYLDTCSR